MDKTKRVDLNYIKERLNQTLEDLEAGFAYHNEGQKLEFQIFDSNVPSNNENGNELLISIKIKIKDIQNQTDNPDESVICDGTAKRVPNVVDTLTIDDDEVDGGGGDENENKPRNQQELIEETWSLLKACNECLESIEADSTDFSQEYQEIETVIKDFFKKMEIKDRFKLKIRRCLKTKLLKRKKNPFDNPIKNWQSIVAVMNSVNKFKTKYKPHIEVALIFCHMALLYYKRLCNSVGQQSKINNKIFDDKQLLKCYFQNSMVEMISEKMAQAVENNPKYKEIPSQLNGHQIDSTLNLPSTGLTTESKSKKFKSNSHFDWNMFDTIINDFFISFKQKKKYKKPMKKLLFENLILQKSRSLKSFIDNWKEIIERVASNKLLKNVKTLDIEVAYIFCDMAYNCYDGLCDPKVKNLKYIEIFEKKEFLTSFFDEELVNRIYGRMIHGFKVRSIISANQR